MVIEQQLESLSAQQLRELTTAPELMAQIIQREQAIASKDRELHYRQSKIDKLTHEIAVLKRNKFGKSSEQLESDQASLLDEAIDADLAAIEKELEQLSSSSTVGAPRQPKRAPLPPQLPRVEMRHEPDSTTCSTAGCGCTLKRIGEDVSEKLDYTPGVFTVERHIRGKWACTKCQSLIQASVPAQEGALQGSGQERRPAQHLVCLEQFVHGQGRTTPIVGEAVRKAPQ